MVRGASFVLATRPLRSTVVAMLPVRTLTVCRRRAAADEAACADEVSASTRAAVASAGAVITDPVSTMTEGAMATITMRAPRPARTLRRRAPRSLARIDGRLPV